MRKALDGLYLVSGVLAACFLALIAVLVLSQTAGRLMGVVVPSANELAGFCVAASAFLGLAPTLNAGGHIRVRLVAENLPASARRWLELFCLATGVGLAAFSAWYATNLVVGSWRFGDVSPGLLAIPLWLPQTAMAAGLVIFTISLADNLVTVARGGRPPYLADDEE